MDNFEKLYKKSLHFLSFRPRSEKEVRDYLKKNKADSEHLEKIINSLKKSKFLDDEEFAKWWIEQRTLINPRALRVIKLELRKKGISEETVDSAISAFQSSDSVDFDSALKLAEKRVERLKNEIPQKKREKLLRYLSSRGFNYETIKDVVDRVLTKRYNT